MMEGKMRASEQKTIREAAYLASLLNTTPGRIIAALTDEQITQGVKEVATPEQRQKAQEAAISAHNIMQAIITLQIMEVTK
jgi:hypothetical protein